MRIVLSIYNLFLVFNTIFVSSHNMYPENPEGTQVIVGLREHLTHIWVENKDINRKASKINLYQEYDQGSITNK